MILAIISQDFKLIFNRISQFFNPIIFFFITVSIFAISLANEEVKSPIYQISIIWLCLIFALIIGINNFLREDFLDGSLEQLLISGNNFELIITSKIMANWFIYSLPLIIFIPLVAIILKIDAISWQNLVVMALIVTLISNLVGCFCAALTISSNKNESLLSILILPLIIPIIIFANSAFIALNDVNFTNSLIFLALIFTFLAPILVVLTSIAVKISLRD